MDVLEILKAHATEEPYEPPLIDEAPACERFLDACRMCNIKEMAATYDLVDRDSQEYGWGVACRDGGLPAITWFIERMPVNITEGLQEICSAQIYRLEEETAIVALLLKQGPIDRRILDYASHKKHILQQLVAYLAAPILGHLPGVPSEGLELLTYIASFCCPVCTGRAVDTRAPITRSRARLRSHVHRVGFGDDEFTIDDDESMLYARRMDGDINEDVLEDASEFVFSQSQIS